MAAQEEGAELLVVGRNIDEAQGEIGMIGNEKLEAALGGRANVAMHDEAVVVLLGAGVYDNGLEGGGQVGGVEVVGRENDGVIVLWEGGEILGGWGGVKKNDGRKLEDAVRAMVTEVGYVNIEQTLGEMARGAESFSGIVRIIDATVTLKENIKKPSTILLKEVTAHNEHVVEVSMVTSEVFLGVGEIVGVLLGENIQHNLEILGMEKTGADVLVMEVLPHLGHSANITGLGQNKIIFGDKVLNSVGVPVKVLDGDGVKLRIDDAAPDVTRVLRNLVKGEIATIVEEAVVVSRLVFPGPVLGGEFAEAGVAVGNVVSGVIIVEPRELGVLAGIGLDGNKNGVVEIGKRLMPGDKDADFGRLGGFW